METAVRMGDRSFVRTLSNGLNVYRLCVKVAYARSGNAHNPTPTYRYQVEDSTGKILGSEARLRPLVEYWSKVEGF